MDGTLKKGRQMLLTEFFNDHYVPRKLRGKSERSVILYRLCIKRFAETVGHNPTVSDLTEDNVLKHLSRRQKVAPATRNKELAELTAMWRLAAQKKMLETWPEIQPEPEPERDPIAWLAEEMQQLLNAATRQLGDIEGVPAWLWWHGLIRLVLDTGERISAVRVAKWNWIQGEWLMVPAEARKGKTRDRRYRLSDVTQQVLAQIRDCKTGDSSVFPWPYCDGYLWDKYKAILDQAGLPSDRKHKFHALRKTTGSVAHAAGLDATDCLDHSDRRTTQRYLDPRFVRDKQPCDVLAEYLRSPGQRTAKPTAKKKTG